MPLLDKEISRLKKEDERTRAMIAGYQGRIENTPIRELALSNKIRDFNNVNETYQVLLKKNAEAQQAENLERRQKGEQFRIIDPARVPEKPFKPDIPKVLAIGLALGLGLGLAYDFYPGADGSFFPGCGRSGNDLRIKSFGQYSEDRKRSKLNSS